MALAGRNSAGSGELCAGGRRHTDDCLIAYRQFKIFDTRYETRNAARERWYGGCLDEISGGPVTPLGPHVIHPPHSIPHHWPILGENDPDENPRDFE